MSEIQTDYFRKPIDHKIINDVWEMWGDGFNMLLIAQACRISANKVSKIIKDPLNQIPRETIINYKKYE